ncbi:hypothetical protein Zm00014a_041350 [Zea mays]
MLSTT